MNSSLKPSLILADDHPLYLKGLEAVLQKQFKILGTATHGGDLVELLEIQKPDAIVLDLQMPVIDGVEAAKRIVIKYPQIKLIILSASYDERIANDLTRIGVKGYLTKDRPVDYLIYQIKSVLADGNAFCKPDARPLAAINTSLQAHFTSDRKLSARELEIIALIKTGLTSSEIANKLFISVNTVEVHRKHIFKKLGLRNVQGLLEYVHTH